MKRQTVIWISFLLLLCGWFVAAADNGDCGLITNTGDVSKFDVYKKFTENFKGANIEWVMPAKAISQALVNLKKACCMSQSINKGQYCEGYTKSENYPNSIILYDQLLDVWLRRLDGNSELAYGIDPDSKGKDRRDFITKAAQDKDGAITAKSILERRNTDRTRKMIYTNDWSDIEFTTAIQNYANRTLADRYYNLCNVVGTIYNKLRSDQTTVIDIETCQSGFTTPDKIKKTYRKGMDGRIADEATYSRVIMIKKSNELLHNTLQAYIQTYFVQNKMMVLTTLLNKVKALFSTMVQQAPASQSCSQ